MGLKQLLLGLSIFVGGFFIAGISAAVFSSSSAPAEFGYYYALIFSVLYLAAIAGVCTSLILKKLDQLKAENTINK